ncbi:hypothetical protein JKF63_00357 [Porcisia hertigi]|uniref:Uncharacterized protein n=1 Tax=Porcisia hertigi TaxID=2761500 RepID=A0A836L6S9_9TRYP|nr:hypothetical protein JKF63_00357 [Porcisia hertigi]
MVDPFLDAGNPLELEVTRLTQENRELRQENARLRARISLSSTPLERASNALSERASAQGMDDRVAAPLRTSAGAKPTDNPSGTLSQRSRKAAVTSAPKQHQQPVVSAARIEEAVQRVKKELRAEVEKFQKAAEVKASQMEQMKQQFEMFVTTTCEREAAYELVYMQLFRDLEEQQALAHTAQAQLEKELEKQRLEAVELRASLQAAMASKCSTLTSASQGSPSKSGDVAAASSAVTLPAKKTRARKAAKHTTEEKGSNVTAAQTTREDAAEEQQQVTEPEQNVTPEPRRLKIAQGGATLRTDSKSARLKRPRTGSAVSECSVTRSRRGKQGAAALAQVHMPRAPLFAATSVSGTVAAAVTSTTKTIAAASTTANSPSSSPRQTTSNALGDFWALLACHTEATHGFLPLWQHLARLRGPDRLTALQVMISLLLHLLGPTNAQIPLVLPASLSTYAVAPPTSITVVVTAIRLLEVQLKNETQQQRGVAGIRTDAAAQECSTLLHSLFYRVCVATLRRWQTAEDGADAVDNWATALVHLYGFQPALSKLMQYTNTTAAYERTRLAQSWITYTAQAIFAQCFTSSSTLSAELAVARWRELCDSVGWSPHSLSLEQLETAAARCVAQTRVGLGNFTAVCAEEALLSLRLVVLYRGFDHMERIATLLELPGVLPMVITKEIYAELVSLAVMDRSPFRTANALQHALRLLMEYLQEVYPERCTSAEHFVSVPRLSHLLATLALLRAESSNATATARVAGTDSVINDAVQEGYQIAIRWLHAQKVALDMVRQSPAWARDRQLLLRDTVLGQRLLSEASVAEHS